MEEGFLRRLALFNALRSEEDTGIFKVTEPCALILLISGVRMRILLS